MSNISDVGQKLYSGTATIGRVKNIIIAILTTFIGGVMLYVGVKNLLVKDKLTSTVPGVIAKSECKDQNCDIEVDYTVNSKNYTLKEKNVFLENPPKVNQTVTVYFDPMNPNDARADELSPKQLGYLSITVALVMLLIAWVGVYMSQRFKFFAAAEGTSTILDIFKM